MYETLLQHCDSRSFRFYYRSRSSARTRNVLLKLSRPHGMISCLATVTPSWHDQDQLLGNLAMDEFRPAVLGTQYRTSPGYCSLDRLSRQEAKNCCRRGIFTRRFFPFSFPLLNRRRIRKNAAYVLCKANLCMDIPYAVDLSVLHRKFHSQRQF